MFIIFQYVHVVVLTTNEINWCFQTCIFTLLAVIGNSEDQSSGQTLQNLFAITTTLHRTTQPSL